MKLTQIGQLDWNWHELRAMEMTASELYYARIDCNVSANLNPETEGLYRDEGSVYARELDRRTTETPKARERRERRLRACV